MRARLIRAACAALVLGTLVVPATPVAPASAASPSCASGGSGFTATICIAAPTSGAVLAGDATVTVTVDIVGTSSGVARVNTRLDGDWLLEDVASPYTFSIPTAKFVDGTHVLSATATLRNSYETPAATVDLSFANGVQQVPTNTTPFVPRTATVPPGQPLVFAATGDGAGGRPEADAVVSMVQGWSPGLFAYLGDVYAKGTPTEFYNWYGHGGSSWDGLRSITNPTVGNHEYEGGVTAGYTDYWGAVPDYYSYDSGGWHFVVLNSNSQASGTAPGSAQYDWLAADLAANPLPCTVAYFHHPVVSAGPQNDTASLTEIWKVLVDGGTDVVLTGHDHQYQRYVPLDRNLQPAAGGTTEFVVGGGGHGIQALVESDPRLAAYSDVPGTSSGALRMQLNPGGASYAYVNTAGVTLDSGVVGCGTSDTQPPSAPTNVTATATSHYQASIGWTASVDDVGVAGYSITRDGAPLADVAAGSTGYVDATAVPGATHTYGVGAFDLAGNRSAVTSAPAVVMPRAPTAMSYTAVADAYVNDASPTTNFGGATTLRVDQSPVMRTYLGFDVGGLTAPVSAATLRVWANTGQVLGYTVRTGGSGWSEPQITSANAPPPGPRIADSGAVAAGTWTEVALPPSTFAAGSGRYDLVLDGLSTTTISMASREDAAHAPQLVLSLAPSGSGPPTAADVALQATEDQSAAWTPSVTDPQGPAGLTCTIAAPPTHGVATVASNCSGGTYTPTTDFNGTDTFTYRVSDGTATDDGSVSVSVAPVDDAPVLSVPSGPVVVSGTDTPVAVTITDVDGDCPLTPTVAVAPAHGSITGLSAGACSAGTTGATVTYRPATGYTGSDAVTVVATDPAGVSSAPATITFTVTGAAANLTFTAGADTYVTSTAPTTSYGTGTQLRADTSPDTRAYVRFDTSGIVGAVTSAKLRVWATASHSAGFRVAPVTGGWSEATTYATRPTEGATVSGSGPLTANAFVDVDVTALVTGNGPVALAVVPVNSTSLVLSSREGLAAPQLLVTQSLSANRPPVASGVTLSVPEDSGVRTWTPIVSDPDGPAGLSCSVVGEPAHGTATVAPDCSGGTYRPTADHNGTDAFTYRVTDGTASADGVVAVTITPVNDAPVVTGTSATTAAGSPVQVTLVATDVDGTCPLSFAIVGAPAHGALGPIGVTGCSSGAASATVTYSPTAGYSGSDGFTFAASDGQLTSAPGAVTVTVSSAQSPVTSTFVATADAYVTDSNPTTNYGTATQLRLDASPVTRSYVRFQVSGIRGPVTSVVLRVMVSANNNGFAVHTGTSGWSESAVTFATAPAPGAQLTTTGKVAKGTWVDIPLSGVVVGNGQVDLVLVPLNGTNLPLASRETTTPPQLIVRSG